MLEKVKTFSLTCLLIFSTNIMAKENKNIDGSIIYPEKNGKYTSYYVNTQDSSKFSYGRKPTKNEIKAWDKDVMPDGTGLPVGSGSVSDGEELYDEQCALCHGDFGAGGKGYPTLSGGKGTLKNQLVKEGDAPPIRTIGSYWPYVTTLYWYIQSAMPFNAPKSLSDDETYAITAYLLSVNEIKVDGKSIDDDFVLSDKNILKTQMPNKDGFYPVSPDRHDLKEMRPFLAQGTRCMKNCETQGVVKINREIDGFYPPLSTKRDLPESKNKEVTSKEKTIYEQTCAMCHANDTLGAPVFGNKEDWDKVLEKGIEVVYQNSIHGLNAMPPKGAADISDDEMKKVVDFMIKSSK